VKPTGAITSYWAVSTFCGNPAPTENSAKTACAYATPLVAAIGIAVAMKNFRVISLSPDCLKNLSGRSRNTKENHLPFKCFKRACCIIETTIAE
jgi:hypothetical protein